MRSSHGDGNARVRRNTENHAAFRGSFLRRAGSTTGKHCIPLHGSQVEREVEAARAVTIRHASSNERPQKGVFQFLDDSPGPIDLVVAPGVDELLCQAAAAG
jgi:hypothetical protein